VGALSSPSPLPTEANPPDTTAVGRLGRPVEILLVDDSPADVRLTEEALRRANLASRLSIARDGEEAMRFLRAPSEQQPRPDLVLLDLNLPRKDGREVLAEIDADDDLRRIPVVVLTTSGQDADILTAYDLKANCYIQKPVAFDEFIRVVGSIQDFWLTIVTLPPS
jgi:chemotaxis family two-component system response regulator Rcp1